ncbi:hypothetical protein VTK56DRAFT_1169 [Thermocarpiscus australiensis]
MLRTLTIWDIPGRNPARVAFETNIQYSGTLLSVGSSWTLNVSLRGSVVASVTKARTSHILPQYDVNQRLGLAAL